MPSRPVRLVACIGVRSSPHLITHFIEHYQRLGVDEFLLALHAERGDPRAEDAKRRLAVHGVRPLREIEEFSARLKRDLFAALVRDHCAPDDWVVYADLDELQRYPDGLAACLERHERRGHAFVRGRLVDRVAANGELIEIRAAPSLLEQFPLALPLTRRVTRGWDRKVCAARARVPIADGGAHAVRYQRIPRWNYRLTHYAPRLGERRIAVDHFKWDATLAQRVRDKLEGRGGDVDRRDSRGFIDEYRRLDAMLRRYGRIHIGLLSQAPGPDNCTPKP